MMSTVIITRSRNVKIARTADSRCSAVAGGGEDNGGALETRPSRLILSHDTKTRPSEHHNTYRHTHNMFNTCRRRQCYNITCVRAIGDTVNTPYNILIDGGIAPMKTTRKSRVSDRAVCKHTRRKAARGRIKCSTIIIIILYYNV